MWTYVQATGAIIDPNGKCIGTGYAGAGEGKNNTAMEAVKNTGPLPRGRWRMVDVYQSARTGPFTITLAPAAGTETFGRSAFRIHGDSTKAPGTASNGCIVAARIVRERMWWSKDHDLLVK